MKVCCKCKEEKSKSEFYKNKSRYDGIASQCKICNNMYTKEYNEVNKKERYRKHKEYRAENKEKISKQGYKYRNSTKEKRKKWAKNRVDELNESYLANILRIPVNSINQNMIEILETKRLTILLKRELELIKNN